MLRQHVLMQQQVGFSLPSGERWAATAFAQEEEDSLPPGYYKPRWAAIKSAIIPGWGQFQNRSYWKIPIIYAAFAGVGYFYLDNRQQYRLYQESFLIKYNNDSLADDPFPTLTVDQAASARDFYRRYRDFAIIGGGLVYLLQIAEAYVHAHLRDFDMSDDLSLRYSPALQADFSTFEPSVQHTLTLKIKIP